MRIRRIDLTFTALLVPLDALALYGAGLSAYLLRYSRFVTDVRPLLQDVPFNTYIRTVTIFVGIWMLLFVLAGLYSMRQRRAWSELGRVILACTAGTAILIGTVFFTRDLSTSRFIVIALWAFAILYVFFERLVLRVIRHLLLRARIGHLGVVIIGTSQTANGIANAYKTNPVLGYTVLKQFATWDDDTQRAIDRLRKTRSVDVILLADPELPKTDAITLIAYAEEQHIAFHYLADLFSSAFMNVDVSTATGVPVIEVKRTPLDGWGRIAKRALDIVFALVALIITSPVTFLSMLLIAIEDGWPVIFKNLRVGERGDLFETYKLRTMYRKYSIGAQFGGDEKKRLELERKLIAERSIKQGPVYKIANDPRITKVGNFLRRWSLDELPNFWNVLMGDMSIVGPRPHQPREVEHYLPHHRRVLAIRPGITGLAQISGRSDLSFEDEVRLDTWYIEHWSILIDLYIVLKTPFAVLYRKGVY